MRFGLVGFINVVVAAPLANLASPGKTVVYRGHVIEANDEDNFTVEYMPITAKNPKTPALEIVSLEEQSQVSKRYRSHRDSECDPIPSYRTDLEALTDKYADRFSIVNSVEKLLVISQDNIKKLTRVHAKHLDSTLASYLKLDPTPSSPNVRISKLDTHHTTVKQTILSIHDKATTELKAIIASAKAQIINLILNSAKYQNIPGDKAHHLKLFIQALEKQSTTGLAQLEAETSAYSSRASAHLFAKLDEVYFQTPGKGKYQ
ncbi:hypothetical protein DSO57_1034646 [Entomophthora muscae]|uniref:Uncharacterized protein n=1 Tax=Entomophthora muscae TaxID=34485 RepID=A0ACC2TM11_9FUNG|nr:hypothetical protein DSO57_1034646 [Entomophthora muscae]